MYRITALAVLHRNLEPIGSGDDHGPVNAERIAIGVAHRIQRSAIQLRLTELGRQTGTDTPAITVDTANRPPSSRGGEPKDDADVLRRKKRRFGVVWLARAGSEFATVGLLRFSKNARGLRESPAR